MKAPDKVNILLVDDNYAKLLSHGAVLESIGENLITASSARQAFEVLLKNEIALILIDVCMPELDGFELAAMIREHPRFCTISIIFVSAILTGGPDQMRGYELGGVDYVSVPVVPELLRAKVKVFIDLYRKTRELERFNAELEQRVAARTVELKTLNDDLERRIEARTREREVALGQLFEAQKTDAIGRLTGGVAHDFNNLLMAVLGSLDLLKKRLPDDDKARRLLDNAMQGAQRGSALTQRLLAFSRRQELKPQSLDLPTLLDGMSDLVHRAIGPGIEYLVAFPEVLPPILADANQLELALLNVILNARDAMPDGGRLTVAATPHFRTARTTEMPLPPGDYLLISIEDSGTGMDADTLARATEPFFTTKGHGKGTGLGLSMVHGLAAQLGGMLKVESQLAWGTTVQLWLPLARTASVGLPDESPATDTPRIAPRRVMVVDDDALVLGGIRAMLEDMGHATLQAQSATDALAQLDGGAVVDIVVTDYAMPVMTGLQLANVLHERDPSLPVILATGYAEFVKDPARESLYRMSKPFSQHDLGVVLASALSLEEAREGAGARTAGVQ